MTECLTDEQLQDIAADVMSANRVLDSANAMASEIIALRTDLANARTVLTEYDKLVDALRADSDRLKAAKPNLPNREIGFASKTLSL